MGGPPQHCPQALCLVGGGWPALSQTPQLVPGSSVPTLKSSVVLEQGIHTVLLHWAPKILELSSDCFTSPSLLKSGL